MSIVIAIGIPDGVVLAADSRQSYTNARQNTRIGSEFGSKLFQLTPRIGLTTFGWAFLQPPNATIMTSIGALVEDFRATVDPNISVVDASSLLATHFQQIYQHDISNLNWVPTPPDQLALGFQIAGYNQNSTVGEVYLASIPPGNAPLLFNTHNPSCIWNGQIDVVSRLVLGFDPRIGNLPFAQHLATNPIPGQAVLGGQLQSLQYQINWHTMTLQDAIDFAILMVSSTIKMQRFSDGISLNPGDIPGCGGNIDVAIITNREGFQWIQKKNLKGEQNS